MFGKGGEGYGPAMWPAWHSLASAAEMMSVCAGGGEGKWRAVCAK